MEDRREVDRRGWVRLWRRFSNHPFWQEERAYSKAEAWIDMFAFRARGVTSTSNGGDAARGEFFASLNELAEAWGWDRMKVSRFLDHCERESMIETNYDAAGKRTRFRILRYEQFQDADLGKPEDRGAQHDASRETVRETVGETVNETASETVSEMAPVTLTDSGSVKYSRDRPPDETVRETVREPAPETVSEPASETVPSRAGKIFSSPSAGFAEKEGKKKGKAEAPGPKTDPAGVPDPAYDYFAEQFLAYRKIRYDHKRKVSDFVQLARLRKSMGIGGKVVPAGWQTAVANFFASELRTWTLAHLATDYDVFLAGPIDRFGQPIGGTHERRESHAQAKSRRTRDAADAALSRVAEKIAAGSGGRLGGGSHRAPGGDLPGKPGASGTPET